MVRIVGTNCVRLVYLICRLIWQSSGALHALTARRVCVSAGVALTCLGSRVGALRPLPNRLLLPAMIGGALTTEFLHEGDDEVTPTRGAAAAENDDTEYILQGLDECVDAFPPHDYFLATRQPSSESDPDVEDDDDEFHDSLSEDENGRDDDDDDDELDDALMSPFTGDVPAGPPLRGGEAPGTAAPALDPR